MPAARRGGRATRRGSAGGHHTGPGAGAHSAAHSCKLSPVRRTLSLLHSCDKQQARHGLEQTWLLLHACTAPCKPRGWGSASMLFVMECYIGRKH